MTIAKSPAQLFLFFLLLFLALGALAGGGLLLIFPSGDLLGMPVSMLSHSPFHDFFIPGLLLFVVLGLAPVLLLIALYRRSASRVAEYINAFKDMHWAWTFTIYIAFALIMWIQCEMIFLQAVHWLHTFYMFYAIVILSVALAPSVRAGYRK